MKRKILAVLLTCSMFAGLCACGSGTGNVSTADGEVEKETQEEGGNESAGENGEIVDIVIDAMTMLELTGLENVEAAMNEITEKEIGVHVILNPVSLFDLDSNNMLSVSSGDQLDLMLALSFTGGTASYISSGACISLDEYIDEYGSDLKEFCGSALASGYSNGKLYSIPAASKHGGGYSYYARKDILEECGIEVDEAKVYTQEDLGEIFAVVKEKYPEMYMLAGFHSNTNDIEFLQLYDCMGGSTANGVLMNLGLDGNTEVVNLYETEEYEEFAKIRYEWAQAGYIPTDAATNTEDGGIQLATGNYFGIFNQDGCIADYEASSGYEMVELTTLEPAQSSQKTSTSFWMVSSTCEHPEKAVALLNLMFSNAELGNLFSFGVEGEDYVIVEEGEGEGQAVVAFPEGLDSSTVPYYLGTGTYSDSSKTYVLEPLTLDYYKELEEYNAQFTEETASKALGYGFDSSDYSSQLTAINSVIAEYCAVISAGATDPETTLSDFRAALKDAGIEDVVAANNEQFNAWLNQ